MTIKVFYRPEMSSDAANSYSPSAGKPAKAVADWQATPEIAPHIALESFEPLTPEQIAIAHDKAYVYGVLDGSIANGFGNASLEVAESLRYTTGSIVAAARHAVQERTIAVSPTSGFHHAGYRRGRGFCTFNGLAIAALTLKAEGLIDHCLVVDGDAHYGDGTASIITTKRAFDWFKQITRGDDDDPFAGLWRTVRGFIQCVGVKGVIAKAPQFWDNPARTLVLYQAGADSWKHDPLGAGVFSKDQLAVRDSFIFEQARKHGVPLVVNLAGGYALDEAGTLEPVLSIHRNTVLHLVDCIETHA